MRDGFDRRRISAAVIVCALCLLCACRKDAQENVPPSRLADRVNLTFEVFNHTQGFLTKYERTEQKGTPARIAIPELEVAGVDENRIVIREGRFGRLIAFGKTGTADFEVPSEDRNYAVYLMNASSGADYRKVDTWINRNEGVLEYAPPLHWYRADRNGYQGPEDVIQDAIGQLNEALSYSWVTYGNFRKIDRRENDSFGVGYGYCRNQFGWHSPYWAGVNPEHCSSSHTRLGTFIEEIFELVTRLNDIGDKDTAGLITDPDTGNLNDVGKDLLAYVFVKDDKI